jgi:hypothetical protein
MTTMDVDGSENRARLEAALASVRQQVEDGCIVGQGPGAFLVVQRGDRGVEIYGNDQHGVTIDPAVDEQLLGEITYSTFDAALIAALRWLNGSALEQLPPGR